MPAPSPTTTSAAKLRFFPPLTTLVTRLMPITWSLSCNAFGSIRLAKSSSCRIPLEFQPRRASSVGQRFDAPVIGIAAPVEDHARNSRSDGALGQNLPHDLCRGDVPATLERLAHILVARRRRDQGVATGVVNHLGINLLERPENI